MKRYQIFLTGAVLAFAVGAQAATVLSAADLAAKNLEARGGADRLAALKSVRFDGKLVFPGDFQLTYQETRLRGEHGDAVRVDASLQGLTVIQAYDGATGWRINPFEGRKDAERMSGDEARALADSGRLDGPMLSARAEGSTLTLLGREDFDGTLAYKVKVAEKDGDEFVYLIDPDSWLEIKLTETRKLRGAQQITEYELGDYETVGGVMYPMSVESWPQAQPTQRQRTIIASATANPSVTAALFAMPMGPTKPGAAATAVRDDAARPPGEKEPPADPKPATSPKAK